MKTVTLTINGRKIKAEEGATILEAAQENNIYIPTLCHHEEVSDYGACRLCTVEVTKNGRQRLVASCLYEVADGLKVETDTERVNTNRQMLMELLLARCPNNKAVKDLAHKLGVEKTSFKLDDNDCMLCALCVRVCQEVVGVSAISLVNRGVDRALATPYFEDSNVCIGCGSCAFVCPVDAIKFEDIGDTRYIAWPNNKMEFKLKKCTNCGRYWIPERQIEFIMEQTGLPDSAFDKCPDCRD
jgi:bidirectional [NiFe] hydrogenase diaphorase subunit